MRIPLWLHTRLFRYACRVAVRRKPDFVIGHANRPYMNRWYIVRTPFGGMYLHWFMRDDDDRALHDHPWPSLSIAIEGAILEIYAPHGTDPRDKNCHHRRYIYPRDVTFRTARHSHRITLLNGLPACTLFFFGPRIRQWGFWCPQGWRHWKIFTGDNPGHIGRGCE